MPEHGVKRFYTSLLFLIYFLKCALSAHLLSQSGLVAENQDQQGTNNYEEWIPKPWINNKIKFGQISGVSIDPDDKIYLFHRADKVWDRFSFTTDEVYAGVKKGELPISQPTILIFNKDGTLVEKLGKNMFYLPHGITVDSEFNIWVTDVALHQVMKLSPHSSNVTLVLGERFVPGSGKNHFCKPTSVAVVANGDFFVADGYCNNRIIKYNSKGEKIEEWGRATSLQRIQQYDLNVPHALTLAEDMGLVCVADRENGRVVCYKISDGTFVTQFQSAIMGQRIFSVAYSSASGGRFYLVNGMSFVKNIPIEGIVLNRTGHFLGRFGTNLSMPHDIAVSADGSTIYVVEIDPYKAWKFVKKNGKMVDKQEISKQSYNENIYHENVNSVEGFTGAVLVTVGCFVFAAGLFVAILVYSKSRHTTSSDTRRLLPNAEF